MKPRRFRRPIPRTARRDRGAATHAQIAEWQEPLGRPSFAGLPRGVLAGDARIWLAALVDSSDDAIFSKTLDGVILSWNAAAERIYGYTAAEIVGQSVARLVPPDRLGELAKIMAALRRGERIDHIETVRVRKDGARIDVSVTISPISDGQGRLVGASAIARDITERNHIRAALRRHERDLADFVENASVGLHWVDAQGIVVWANQTELAMLGYDQSEYVGHPIANFHVDQDTIRDILARLARRETLRDYEARLRCKDGSIRHVLIDSNVLWENGKFARTRCFTRDVTDRKRAERELEASSRRLQSLFDATLDAILIADDEGRYVDANAAACSMLGYSPDELAQLSVWDITPLASKAQGMAIWRDFIAAGTQSGEYVCRRKDGSTIDAEYRAVANFVPGLHLSVLRDITARKQAERERVELIERERAARAEAQDALRSRDQFLLAASHELKTPLTSLLGNAQLLRRRVERDGAIVERDLRVIRVVAEQSERLGRMISALLDISRIQTGQLDLELAPVDLDALASRVAAEIQPTLSRHTIDCVVAQTPLVVMGDELRLEQVLQNLIQNGVKYSPEGGAVHIVVWGSGANAYLSVSDKGIGIPATALSRLFERFYRAENVTAQQIGGIGIGLYVCKEIVTLHGGDLAVESVEGAGSTFTVSLPLLPPVCP